MVAPRTFRLSEIARLVGGELIGDGSLEISGIATLSNATPFDLSFLTQSRYRSHLTSTKAGAVLLCSADRDTTHISRVICPDPYLAFAIVATLFHPPRRAVPGIHPSASVELQSEIAGSAEIGSMCSIAKGVRIGEETVVGAGVHIGENVEIGNQTLIHPNVTIYADCVIGHRVIIHSGAVIGADGFGMARNGEAWMKIPQTGKVVVGNDVEIGANTTIDRGALDDTVIEEGVKLDNQIQIGHNVHIGAHCAFAGCVGIAGSARIGRRCTIGGGSVVLGHIQISDDVHIGAGTIVMKSIARSGDYAGIYPAQKREDWARNAVLLRNLDELVKRVAELERITEELGLRKA